LWLHVFVLLWLFCLSPFCRLLLSLITIAHAASVSSPKVSRAELDTIIAGDDASALAQAWLGEASVFENEIVAKMFRDVASKMGSTSGPPTSPGKAW
jgi:hypothetical protein